MQLEASTGVILRSAEEKSFRIWRQLSHFRSFEAYATASWLPSECRFQTIRTHEQFSATYERVHTGRPPMGASILEYPAHSRAFAQLNTRCSTAMSAFSFHWYTEVKRASAVKHPCRHGAHIIGGSAREPIRKTTPTFSFTSRSSHLVGYLFAALYKPPLVRTQGLRQPRSSCIAFSDTHLAPPRSAARAIGNKAALTSDVDPRVCWRTQDAHSCRPSYHTNHPWRQSTSLA